MSPARPDPAGLKKRMRAFGDALAQAIAAHGYSQETFAKKVGIAQGTVSGWITAVNEPRYETVFAIEQAIPVKPGMLSRHLGYLPIDAVKSVADVRAALREDPGLTDVQRDTLQRIYDDLVKVSRSPRGRKRTT
jgi:transcriptional regulator with XRE-family HTH domain